MVNFERASLPGENRLTVARSNQKLVVRVSGGTGNQLFQFAFAYSLYKKFLSEIELDVSSYSRDRNHDGFQLGGLLQTMAKIQGRGFETTEFESFLKFSRWSVSPAHVRERQPYVFQEIELSRRRTTVFFGFWQSWKYLEPHEKEFCYLLESWLESEAEGLQIEQRIPAASFEPATVMVHIRRGDYTRLKKSYGLLGPAYYKRAMNLLRERVENPLFLVFSDDPELVRSENIFDSKVEFFEDAGLSSAQVLSAMSSCSHFILGNSTFSWWAGFLGSHRSAEAMIVSPQNWFRDRLDLEDFVPQSWIRVPEDWYE